MFGWRDISGVVVHHIGPKLAFSIGRDGLTLPPDHGIKAGDTVVVSFGEIDCRCHIHKHVSPVRTYQSIIEAIVLTYIQRISELSTSLPGVRWCIYNVVPPVERHTSPENREYPFLGSDEERKSYTQYFNNALATVCGARGLTFIDVYNAYSNDRGYLNRHYSDGHVHIKNPVYIRDAITKYSLL